MSLLMNRVWMAAASVVAGEGHGDYGSKLNSSRRPLNVGNQRSFSTVDERFCGGSGGGESEENRRQAEESLQRVMYLNCWTQS
ncbi:hypothetical protein SLE2022_013660 [Rubroshorea leprosula]